MLKFDDAVVRDLEVEESNANGGDLMPGFAKANWLGGSCQIRIALPRGAQLQMFNRRVL